VVALQLKKLSTNAKIVGPRKNSVNKI